jgi:hypothetical protein
VIRLVEPRTIVRSPLTRRQTGYDLDLDGFDTDHISLGDTVLYRNPFQRLRLNDEEIAISTFLTAMADWCRGEGAPPYPQSSDHVIPPPQSALALAAHAVVVAVEAVRVCSLDGEVGLANLGAIQIRWGRRNGEAVPVVVAPPSRPKDPAGADAPIHRRAGSARLVARPSLARSLVLPET